MREKNPLKDGATIKSCHSSWISFSTVHFGYCSKQHQYQNLSSVMKEIMSIKWLNLKKLNLFTKESDWLWYVLGLQASKLRGSKIRVVAQSCTGQFHYFHNSLHNFNVYGIYICSKTQLWSQPEPRTISAGKIFTFYPWSHYWKKLPVAENPLSPVDFRWTVTNL